MMEQRGGLSDRLAGGLVGLLVGDALGVPYEFHPPDSIPPRSRIEMEPPPGFRRTHPTVPVGTWSDDGAQALALLASLLERDGLDLHDFGERLLRWRREGYLAVDGRVYDIGIQTSRALSALEAGANPSESGPDGERDNGNGSLMRVLPLALWHQGSDAELVELADRQSLPTHGHLRSRLCCAFYCLWARAIIEDCDDPWQDAAHRLQAALPDGGDHQEEARFVLDPENHGAPRGSGYVVDTLWSSRLVLEASSDFEGVVRGAVALGNDTDTTAAVAGGLAGIRHGLGGIPRRWREELRGADLLQPLLDDLLKRAGREG